MIQPPLSRLKTKPGNQESVSGTFSAAWQSPSNIALVKYWGKKNGQFPLTPSLSMTLLKAFTQTRVDVVENGAAKGFLSVNGDENHPFLPKIKQLLTWLGSEIPILSTVTLKVITINSFPHSTGIASSASGLSALTLCLLDVASEMLQVSDIPRAESDHMASYCARVGSGSACRSLYGGYTVWGETPGIIGSSDEFAIPVNHSIHPEMMLLHDAILVISEKPKILSSTLGHSAMHDHPFIGGRILQAEKNLDEALSALAANDFGKLASVAESEALTLHALIMSANPGVLLMKPATVEVIHRVREARRTGLPVFFTLDAGANVHVMYPHSSAVAAEKFIGDALLPLCENGRVIFDSCGSGPQPIADVNPAS
ncbi:MAG: diphosphomevalonate/mevalonate 3,5-bisphosphate decarboxylase family protein [Bacteroidales bacterium]